MWGWGIQSQGQIWGVGWGIQSQGQIRVGVQSQIEADLGRLEVHGGVHTVEQNPCCLLRGYYAYFAEEKYGRDTRVIPVDFSDGVEIYSQLAEELSSLDIGVLGK